MNVMLFYGGKSNEHDVSLITGCLAKAHFDGDVFCAFFDGENNCFLVDSALTPQQHQNIKTKNVLVFPTGRRQAWVVKHGVVVRKIDVDVAVNCCHGGCGEDGSLSGLLRLANIPYVGSSVASSAVAMDKTLTKIFLRSLGVDVVESVSITNNQFITGSLQVVEQLGYPVIVKPAGLGSSIGISIAENAEQLQKALNLAFTYDDSVLCEKALTNFNEFNCAVLNVNGKNIASNVEMPVMHGKMLSFGDKYLAGAYLPKGERKSNLPSELLPFAEKAKETAVFIYQALGFGGVVRFDFLLDNTSQRLYLNEINAVPGSLAYNLFQDTFGKQEFGALLIGGALADFDKRNKLTYVFMSDILKSGHAKNE